MKIFDQINNKNQQKLLRMLESDIINVPKNNTILSTISNDNIIGIIKEGCIQIIKTDDNGNQIIIDELTTGEVFGSYIAFFNNKDYSIQTKEESEIIIIDYDILMNFNQNTKEYYNQFIKNLLTIIMSDMKKTTERLEILTRKTIRNRLLEYFNISLKNSGTKHIYLPFNFTDLAHYLAVDRSAMMRELKYMKEEKIIEVKGNKITLLTDKYSSIYM